MKRITLFLLVFICNYACLQSQDLKEYQKFLQDRSKNIEDYSDQKDKEFLKMINNQWQSFEARTTQRTKRDFPIVPQIYSSSYPKSESVIKIRDTVKRITIKNLISNKITIPKTILSRIEDEEIGIPQTNSSIDFYGIRFKLPIGQLNTVGLNGILEKDISNFYNNIKKKGYREITTIINSARDEFHFPDWPLYLLIRDISDKIFKDSNCSAIFQMILMNDSGFDTRVCRAGSRILVMLPIEEEIYGYSFVNISGANFYIIGDVKGSIFTFNLSDKESIKSLKISFTELSLPSDEIHKTINLSENKIDVILNRNLINLLNEFPSMHFSNYCKVPISTEIATSVINYLRQKTSNLSNVDAANYLLKFVQTSFNYKTDDEQFGGERVLFSDEIFHYPFSDCEDRSILFSQLVKEILKLKVALVNYPNHLATAVAFETENLNGDYFVINNTKFHVCDPTYINAPIGTTMPNYINSKASIYLLD